ncbi:MAG: adenylate/guanylate cyclase domain-containing protein [Pseudomonadota bacterium]
MANRLLGFVLLVFLVSLRISDPQFLQSIRHQSFDLYQQLKPRQYMPVPVTIVDLDEQSLREYGQWPWPRTRIAQLIDRLTQMGAITIGFDIIFAEPDRLSPAQIARDNSFLPRQIARELSKLPNNEKAMAEAMRRNYVVIGQSTVRNRADETEAQAEFQYQPPVQLGEDPSQFLNDFPQLVRNVGELERAAKGLGVITVEQDSDGIIRRVPLIIQVEGKIWTSLSIETLRVASGGNTLAIRTHRDGIEQIVIAPNQINTDAQGRIWPYFTKSVDDRFVSIASILNGTADPAKINGRMVLVGTSAVGLEDYRSIPVGERVPGVEVHAQVIENILTDQTLTRNVVSERLEMLGTAIIGLLIVLLVPSFRAIVSFCCVTILIFGTLMISWWFFSQQLLLVDATWPIMTFSFLFIFGATANYIREEQKRREIRGAFGQYLSPALVDQLSDNPERLVLGGQTKELSVLFTDVRGFTTISESYKDYPQGLTQLMNRFLTVLSQPILDRNGTIDKYMGDAIMAFWNAPVDEEDHAMQACLSALDMISNVAELNRERQGELSQSETETYHEINVGVGINTGPCVVGNMGSHNRFDYTALGDTVNLASRLEGQSKPYGLPIVIGSSTANVVMDKLAVYEIDLIRVKGKNEPVKIYALGGDAGIAKSDDFVAFRAMNAAMLSAYRTQDWTSAFEALEMLDGLGEKLNLPIEEYIFIYETRIAEFRANPPGPNWDGVYTATSK